MMMAATARVCVFGCLLASCSAFAGLSPQLAVPGVRALRGGGVSMSAKPKLTYFDARGVAEMARVMYKAAGADFEDERFGVIPGPPPKSPPFEEAKEQGRCEVNLNRVPLLAVGDKVFGQSHAINRYIAQQNGFMGDSPLEAAMIDSIYENVRDIRDAYSNVRFRTPGTPEEKAAATQKFLKEDLVQWCTKLDKALAAYTPTESDYAFGGKLSLADFAIHTWIESLDLSPVFKDWEGERPWAGSSRISRVYKMVNELPAVKQWMAERPVTMM